ncbi:MAG: glycosyltransferase family 39 protein [Deltaproteobacteria bacterium]|nr:glycosyltransferase family 39 protein [Deltaproteobacteria bacterium]
MSLLERIRRVPTSVWAALFAFGLLLPGLGSFGFWDPWELNLADRAREVSISEKPLDGTVGGRYTREPPADMALAALGIRAFGATEWGARLPNALLALATLAALYWAVVGFASRRAAALSVLVLVTMPLFFQQARQLTSDVPLILGLTLSMGGLGRFVAPGNGRGRGLALILAVLGLTLGFASGGVLLGVALPLLCLAGALLGSWSMPLAKAEGDEPEPTVGRQWLRTPRGWLALVLALVGVVLFALSFAFSRTAGVYSPWLGAAPRGTPPTELFIFFVRQLGFGLFPWSAVALFSLGRVFDNAEDENPPSVETARDGFIGVYAVVWASFAFALFTVVVLMTGEMRFAALAPLALASGIFLDRISSAEPSRPVLGLLIAIGTVVIARDLFLAPEELFSVHILRPVKWPPLFKLGPTTLVVGLLIGAALYLALAMRSGAAIVGADPSLRSRIGSFVMRFVPLAAWLGRQGVAVSVAVAIGFSALCTFWVTPELSRHFSFKPVFESFKRYASPGDVFARYRVQGHGSHFYTAQAMEEMRTQDDLVNFFRKTVRAFGLVPNDDLAALDAAFKSAKVPYYVVDASSSRFILLSNQLAAGQGDANPLIKDVWMSPTPPVVVADPAGGKTTTVTWSAERPPWSWPFPQHFVYDDTIELVGADFPREIARPDKLAITLYFRVIRPPPAGYKIFLHVDTPGHPRLIGDHDPLAGVFPTSYWLPGEYIRDRHEIDLPYMTTQSGSYTVFMGFWPGGERARLKVTEGASDGQDRANLGSLFIR